MEYWYHTYFSQRWYANTFLVNLPPQVGRAIEKDREWNNIRDSGCYFTCLAMILGIDPARLSSLLGSEKFFRPDRKIAAKLLNGKFGGLVWDQNAPDRKSKQVKVGKIWHPILGRPATLILRYITDTKVDTYEAGKELVKAIHDRNNHVICGPEHHAYLVAGYAKNDYFAWDPDCKSKHIETHVVGGKSLRQLFRKYRKLGFVEYEAIVG